MVGIGFVSLVMTGHQMKSYLWHESQIKCTAKASHRARTLLKGTQSHKRPRALVINAMGDHGNDKTTSSFHFLFENASR